MNWIPVTEQFPNSGQCVLGLYKNEVGKWRIFVGVHWISHGWHELVKGGQEFIPMEDNLPIYWMPLPSPPEEA